MMKNTLTLVLLQFWFFNGFVCAQNDLSAYKLYNTKGKEVDFKDMVKDMEGMDVVLFGEMHNSAIDHWLQLELTKALAAKRELVLGAEMFESDDQVVLNEYLASMITSDHLKKEAKLWPNYATDYAPLVEFAKENEIPFIATNVPRRYASMVSKQGPEALEQLDEFALQFLPPLPYTVTPEDRGYDDMREMMGAHGHGMNVDYLIAAQALKDFTMAHFILKHLTDGKLFVHYNGTYHSQYFEGIVNYLLRSNPDMKIGVIASVSSEDMEFDEEWSELGSFIIVTPVNMTKTH